MSAELDAGDRPRLLSDGDVSGKRRPWMLGYGASGGLVLGFILGIVIGIVIGSMPPITQRCHQTVAMATRHDASPTARPLLPSSPPPPSPPLSSSPPPRSHAVPAPARALPPIHTDPEQRLERCKQDLLVSRAQAEDKRPPSPPPPLPSPAPLLLPSCTVWGICELHFEIEPTTQPFETELHATLESYDDPTQRLRVRGFYDGGGIYRARLSPPIAGRWRWSTSSSAAGLDGRTGEIMVSEDLEPGVLPPVHADGRVFRHADGREHFSVGTTAYAWIHQSDELLEQTFTTLKGPGAAFNKLRMTIFPKYYWYNRDDPADGRFPYRGSRPGSRDGGAWVFDTRWFDVVWWAKLERLVARLRQQGVVADLILFHPYDHGRWGFDCLGGMNPHSYNTSNDRLYLEYAVARLGAFSNVWWSLANEWDYVRCKSQGLSNGGSPVWDELGETLASEDAHRRPKSIHNGAHLYNHSRAWVSHVSLQGKLSEIPSIVGGRFGVKPVVWDETKYEGNIPLGWGRLRSDEMVDRFWLGLTLGVYVGHGETYLQAGVAQEEQTMWWSKGGSLRGFAPPSIGWFRDRVTDPSRPPFSELVPLDAQPLTGCQGQALVQQGSYALFRLTEPCVDRRSPHCSLRIPGLAHGERFRVRLLHPMMHTTTMLDHGSAREEFSTSGIECPIGRQTGWPGGNIGGENHSTLVELFVEPPALVRGWSGKLRRSGDAVIASLRSAAQRGVRSFRIAPGEYELGARTITLSGISDMVVRAAGVTFWFVPGGGLRLFDCHNLRWEGDHPLAPFAIDYDPPAYAQGRLTSVDRISSSSSVEAVFDTAFPMPSSEEAVFSRAGGAKVALWSAATRTMLRSPEGAVNAWFAGSTPLGQNGTRWRIEIGGHLDAIMQASPPQVGDLITVAPSRGPHALELDQCGMVTLRAFHIYGGTCMGIVEHPGRGANKYEQLRIGRRDGSSHLLSVTADGFHSVGVGQGATIRASEIAFTGDDLINIHNAICIVLERLSGTELVVADPKDTIFDTLGPGDDFALFDLHTREQVASGILAASPETYDGGWAEKIDGVPETLQGPPYNLITRGAPFTARRVFRLQFDSPLAGDVRPFLLGQSLSKGNRNATISDSWLHDSYARAALLQSTGARAERLLVQRAGGVHVSSELEWLEGDLALQDVQVVDSTFEQCGEPAIEVSPQAAGTVLRGNSVEPTSRAVGMPPFLLPLASPPPQPPPWSPTSPPAPPPLPPPSPPLPSSPAPSHPPPPVPPPAPLPSPLPSSPPFPPPVPPSPFPLAPGAPPHTLTPSAPLHSPPTKPVHLPPGL